MAETIKAKTIKFNLIMDKDDDTGEFASVRSIEGLQENFSIEDVIKYFDNKLLERWLEVRGFTETLEKIRQIDRNSDRITIARELVKIFNVEFDDEDIKEAISSLEYEKSEREWAKLHRDKRSVVSDYITKYDKLVENMCSHGKDWANLSADVSELQEQYSVLAERLHDELFYLLKEKAPMAIFVMLVNSPESVFRKLWLSEIEYDNCKALEFETLSKIKGHISAMLQPDKLREILGDKLEVREAKQDANDTWCYISGEAVAVLYINSSELVVKNGEEDGEELDMDAVNGKVQLLKGLQYKCSADNAKLYYVEV